MRGLQKKAPADCQKHEVKQVLKIDSEYKIKCMICGTFIEHIKMSPKKKSQPIGIESFDF
tara:strand:- start:2028 stop:2207 length:180 start_codon:yes stop_codon:yes gene_type:complete